MIYSNKLTKEETAYLIKITSLSLICAFLSAKYTVYLIKVVYMIYTNVLTYLWYPDVIMGIDDL